MFQFINDILSLFRGCFKREKAWNWFVCVVVTFMVRNERRGVANIISALRIKPWLYETAVHFFRSDAYAVHELYERWTQTAQVNIALYEESGRVIVMGDHTKVSKEGRRMPDITVLHQESDNSGKPEYIEGHNYGFICALATNGTTFRPLMLRAELQESKTKTGGASLVEQLVECGGQVSNTLGKPATLILDAYFCSGTTFTTADRFLNKHGCRMLEIITRTKSDTIAYTLPSVADTQPKRGRPRKYGEKVKLNSLFTSSAGLFTETSLELYGKNEKVRYLCMDLFWKPCQSLIRFVLAETTGNRRIILMSSDLNLSPEKIITLYGLRFKIETGFAELKNDIGCFDYHFWTKSLPKRSKRQESEPSDDPKTQHNIVKARQAIATHVCLACIATGILTIIAFRFNREIFGSFTGYLRTIRTEIPSVNVTKHVVAQELPFVLLSLHNLPAFQCIIRNQRPCDFSYRYVA